MTLPNLVSYATEVEYKKHYIDNYCNSSPIMTFDGIPVKFYEDRFEHAFYKRVEKKWKSPKDRFCRLRGERIDWIKHVLQDPTIEPKKGYDHAKQTYDNSRRITFMNSHNYIVVIMLDKKNQGKFLTAYLVDNEEAADKIRNSPKWDE